MTRNRLLALAMVGACGTGINETDGRMVEASGRYVLGFETNVFTPCGVSRGWWVTSLDSVPEVRSYLAAHPVGGAGYVTAFARWRGIRSDSGQYGHLGGFAYEFEPRETIEVRDTTMADCKP